jgi:Condensation domain
MTAAAAVSNALADAGCRDVVGVDTRCALGIAMHVAARLDVDLRVEDVVSAGSARSLVAAVDELMSGQRPGRGWAEVPLVRAQQRILLPELTCPGLVDNLVTHAYRGPSPVDAGALDEAVGRVVARHAVLSRRIGWTEDGVPVSIAASPEARVEQIQGVTPAATWREAAARATADWWDRPLDIENEAPFRVRLARTDGCDLVCLSWHHIAYDGWSGRLVERDLQRAYADVLAGRQTEWQPLPRFAAYAYYEAAQLPGWILQELPFWRTLLAAAPPPLFAQEPNGAERPRRDIAIQLADGEVPDFDRLARRDRLAVLLHLAAEVLCAVTDRPAARLTTVTSGRADPSFRDVAGCFLNPLTVPIVPGRHDLADTRQLVAQCLRHSLVPFDEVARILPEDTRSTPVDVMVSLNDWSLFHRSPRDTPVVLDGPRTSEGLVLDATSERRGQWTLRARFGVGSAPAAVGETVVTDLAAALRAADRSGRLARFVDL